MAEVPTTDTATEEADPLAAYAALIDEVKTPISEGKPTGDDVRYDDAFQELKSEIDRIGSAATDIDYDRILELSRKILREKSKDLNTAGYLIVGLSRTEGVKGLAEAFVIMHTLVETFWEQIHPDKPVRRRNAIQFATDRAKEWLDLTYTEDKPTEDDRVPFETLEMVVKKLQTFTMEQLAENAPALSGLTASLRDVMRRLPKPVAPEPETAKPATSTPAGDGSTTTAPSTDAGVSTDFKSASDANMVVIKAVTYLREQDKTSAVPYRLLRALRWGILTQEPPNENGTTKVPVPIVQRRTYLNGLLEKGEFETLVEEAEASFQQSPFHFWLDAQRLIASAAEALGVPYQPVADAVLEETALLVRRLPGLPKLTFADGTPFADVMTQEWLETKVSGLLGEGGGGGGGPKKESGGSNHVEKQFQEARQKLGEGDLAGALATMQGGRAEDVSQEDHFRRRLYQALLCVRGNQPAVARPLLESLDEEVQRHALDAWNPALTLEVWSNLYQCYQRLVKTTKGPDQAVLQERAAQVMDKIARLDAGYALTVMS